MNKNAMLKNNLKKIIIFIVLTALLAISIVYLGIISSILLILSLIFLIILTMWMGMVYSNIKPQMQSIDYKTIEPDYWPTQGWQRSTPEAQGMDSARILAMMEFYKAKRTDNAQILIDSIMIVRNGYIVTEIYPNPLFPENTKHIIQSCTKSIMSALIGIAIEHGYIAQLGAGYSRIGLVQRNA